MTDREKLLQRATDLGVPWRLAKRLTDEGLRAFIKAAEKRRKARRK